MSIDTQPYCPTCTQPIGGSGLLRVEIETLRVELDGLKVMHKRELDLRVATEGVRDELTRRVEELVKALDTAEEDLMVLGQKLLAQAKGSMKL